MHKVIELCTGPSAHVKSLTNACRFRLLLHQPRGQGQILPSEAAEHGSRHLQVGDLMVEVTRHDAFTEQLEAMDLSLDKAAPMMLNPLLPDIPAKLARRHQNGISRCGRIVGPSIAWHYCESG